MLGWTQIPRYRDQVRMLKLLKARLYDHGDLLFRYRHFWPWLVLFLSLTLVAGFGRLLIRYVERQDRQVMQIQAVELAASIEQRIKSSEGVLRATGTAFAFAPQIDENFFSSYFKGLQFDLAYGGIVGIGWTVPVTRERLSALEAKMRAERHGDFFVWPVTGDRLNYAILYVRPNTKQNQAVIGYNMYSDAVRRRAMLKAYDTGMPHASGPVFLKQDVGHSDQPGFLLYVPVYDATRRRGSEAPVKTSFRGYVYAAFRVGDLVNASIKREQTGQLDLELYDVTDGARQLLYDSRPEIWSAKNDNNIGTTLTVSGRRWELIVAPVYSWQFKSFPQHVLMYFLLATGVLVSMMVWLTIRSMSASRAALEKQSEQMEIRSILLRELNHRVKNTLATVNSLAALSRDGAADVPSYYEALSGRLRALSATHDLLTSSDWGETELRDIAEAELAPFRGVKGQVLIEGPAVQFDPTKALSLGLSIHELATNASKYGALSSPDGRVSLLWHEEDGRLLLRWSETGGAPVKEQNRRGFGSMLIEKLMARQLRAQVKLSFPPEGAICEFSIPLDKPSGLRRRHS